MKKILIALAVIVGIGVAVNAGSSDDTTSSTSNSSSSSKKADKKVEKVEKAEPEMTTSQESALRKAESYLDFSGFSRGGLIEQLEFEDFSTADAEFAVDHVDVNWKEQAAIKAEQYLDISGYSRQGLIDQLMFEKFTQAQAEYGVKKAGL